MFVYGHRMSEPEKWIAFCGSMKASEVMIDYAVRAVDKALKQGNFIMVGDNPKGIDYAIYSYLQSQKVERMAYSICTAVGEQPRSVSRWNQQDFTSKRRFEDYQNRDFNMVDFADITLCIWDKTSKGTKSAFDYACQIGREAYLVTFDTGRPVLLSSIKESK